MKRKKQTKMIKVNKKKIRKLKRLPITTVWTRKKKMYLKYLATSTSQPALMEVLQHWMLTLQERFTLQQKKELPRNQTKDSSLSIKTLVNKSFHSTVACTIYLDNLILFLLMDT